MERLPILLNGIDLAKCGVVQNEDGWYYASKTNPNAISVTTLAKFNTWTPPAGVILYKNGSHTKNPSMRRLDFRAVAGSKLSFGRTIKVNGLLKLNGFKNPYGVEIVHGDRHIHLSHTHLAPGIKVGQHYPEGTVIAIVNSQSENASSAGNFPPHLEINLVGGKIREIILQPETVINPIKPKIGTLLKWNTKVNLRDNPSASAKDIGDIQANEQAETQKESVVADNYEWIGVKSGFAVIQDMKTGERFVTEVAPPEDPKDKEIRELKAQVKQLEADKTVLGAMVHDRDLKITSLEELLNTTQQERNKILSDCNSISELLSVSYDPSLVWIDEGETVGQHYKFEGAIATIENEAVNNATLAELIQAVVNKLIKKRNV